MMAIGLLLILSFSAQAMGSVADHFKESLQVILVVAQDENSPLAQIENWENGPAGWTKARKPFPAVLGKKGTATGNGVFSGAPFAVSKEKMEGDGRTPTGIFEIGKAYGTAESKEFSGKIDYQRTSSDWIGVDDPNSIYYNQIIRRSQVKVVDWSSFEKMRRQDDLYTWLVEVKHNPKNTPGMGSLIFMHVWRSKASGTAGCIASEKKNTLETLRWLDPVKKPKMVVILASRLADFKKSVGFQD